LICIYSNILFHDGDDVEILTGATYEKKKRKYEKKKKLAIKENFYSNYFTSWQLQKKKTLITKGSKIK